MPHPNQFSKEDIVIDKTKWCESWEKNFDSTFKAIGKFKDDLKTIPHDLNSKTQSRVKTYINLLMMELDEIQEEINKSCVEDDSYR